jgi:hypothetical protein
MGWENGGRLGGQFLSGTAVKITGVVLMAADHFHQMFAFLGAPYWLGWFGRPVAALFIFLCAEGFHYTRNRKRYLLRLLAGFFFMSLMNGLFSSRMRMEETALTNNIFGTLFIAAFYMRMVELLKEGFREKRGKPIALAAGGIILSLLAGLGVLLALGAGNRTAVLFLLFIPNPVSAEGGFVLIGMGLLFYLLRKYRLAQIGVLLAISALSWQAAENSADFQWLMAAAAVPLFLYNGKRGRGSKYFFYIFYPAHLYLFYVIAWFLRP